MHGLILSFQNSYYLAAEVTLEQNIQASLTESIIAIKNQSGFLEYWENRKSLFFVEFRDYITSILTSDSEVIEGVYKNSKDEGKVIPD